MDVQTRDMLCRIDAEHMAGRCAPVEGYSHCHCTNRTLSLKNGDAVECMCCHAIIKETRPIDKPSPRYALIQHTEKNGEFWVYDSVAKMRVGDSGDLTHTTDRVKILNDHTPEKMEDLYSAYLIVLRQYGSAHKAREILILLSGWLEIVVSAIEVEDCRRRFA